MLAVMDTNVQGILFLLAVLCFLGAAFLFLFPRPATTEPARALPAGLAWVLVSLGLALSFFVFMYNAFDA